MTGPIQRKIAGPFSYVDTGSICQGVREWVWHKDVFAFKYFPPIPLRWEFKKRKRFEEKHTHKTVGNDQAII